MIQSIQSLRTKIKDGANSSHIAIELNTSCPNIPNSPPSGYSFPSLVPLLNVLKDEYELDNTLTIGLKLPPFVYRDQFLSVIDGLNTLSSRKCSISFLTCTNTLGNTLVFSDQSLSPLSSSSTFAVPPGLGGSAGDAIHALSLGNVHTFSQLLHLPENSQLNNIQLVGVGGVTSKVAAERMRKAGAAVVGSATFFGRLGVDAFRMLTIGE
jgi:dihydroorotate dehydrogenase (fumarate)